MLSKLIDWLSYKSFRYQLKKSRERLWGKRKCPACGGELDPRGLCPKCEPPRGRRVDREA